MSLLSVSKMCDAGRDVHFLRTGEAYSVHRETCEVTALVRRKGGLTRPMRWSSCACACACARVCAFAPALALAHAFAHAFALARALASNIWVHPSVCPILVLATKFPHRAIWRLYHVLYQNTVLRGMIWHGSVCHTLLQRSMSDLYDDDCDMTVRIGLCLHAPAHQRRRLCFVGLRLQRIY